MRKSTIIAVLMLSFGFLAKAQDQPLKKKPPFNLNPAAMTELGVTEEQKANIETARNRFRVLRSKFELDIRKNDTLAVKRQDSVLTAVQLQKVSPLREAIATDGKPNPWYRKTVLLFDAKVIEDLTITPEQKQKLTSIQRDYNNVRRIVGEKSNKVTADSVQEQENLLNETQKKRIAEIKAEIAEYNKNIK